MKRFWCIIVAVTCLSSLASCSKNKDYANDVSALSIYEEISDVLEGTGEYFEFNELHIEQYFPNTDEYDDHYAVYSADVNDINEIGIFKAPDEFYALGMLKSCETYISDMKEHSRAFIASYAPQEIPKLDEAQARRFGQYVVYLVLPDDLSEIVFDRIDEFLSAD